METWSREEEINRIEKNRHIKQVKLRTKNRKDDTRIYVQGVPKKMSLL